MGNQQVPQNRTGVGAHLDLQIGDRERDHEVVHDVLAETQSHRGEHPTRITLQHLDDAKGRRLDPLGFLLGRNEDRRVGDLGPDVVTDQHDDRGQPERDSPTPGEERCVGQRGRQDQEHDRRQ